MSTTISNATFNDTVHEFSPPDLGYAVPVGLLLGLFTVLTVAGNLMVIVAVGTDRQLRTQRHSMLIANLAVFDMTLGWSVFPFSASLEFLNDQWVFGRFFCTMWAAVDVLCCTGSIWFVCSFYHAKLPFTDHFFLTLDCIRISCIRYTYLLLSTGHWYPSRLIDWSASQNH